MIQSQFTSHSYSQSHTHRPPVPRGAALPASVLCSSSSIVGSSTFSFLLPPTSVKLHHNKYGLECLRDLSPVSPITGHHLRLQLSVLCRLGFSVLLCRPTTLLQFSVLLQSFPLSPASLTGHRKPQLCSIFKVL